MDTMKLRIASRIRTLVAAAGLAAGVLAAPAQAAPLFAVTYSPIYGSTENTGASALATFTFTDVSGDVLLTIGITNTTNGTLGLGATQATLVGLTFDLSTGASFQYNGGSAFPSLITDTSLPPYGSFDICIRTSGDNCVGGNPGNGLTAGQSTTVTFQFDTALSAAQLGDLFRTDYLDETNDGSGYDTAARFQQVNAGGGSDKVIGRDPPLAAPDPNQVPEPGTLTLLLAALVGILLARRASTASA